MRIRATLVAAMLLVALTWPGSAAGQTPTSWFGTWTYNAAKSTTAAGPVPFKRATCRIEPWEDGVRVTYDLVRVRGGIERTSSGRGSSTGPITRFRGSRSLSPTRTAGLTIARMRSSRRWTARCPSRRE